MGKPRNLAHIRAAKKKREEEERTKQLVSEALAERERKVNCKSVSTQTNDEISTARKNLVDQTTETSDLAISSVDKATDTSDRGHFDGDYNMQISIPNETRSNSNRYIHSSLKDSNRYKVKLQDENSLACHTLHKLHQATEEEATEVYSKKRKHKRDIKLRHEKPSTSLNSLRRCKERRDVDSRKKHKVHENPSTSTSPSTSTGRSRKSRKQHNSQHEHKPRRKELKSVVVAEGYEIDLDTSSDI